jgi:hypothetical protein
VCLRDDQGSFVTAYAKRLEGKPVIAKADETFKVVKLYFIFALIDILERNIKNRNNHIKE